MKPAIVVVLAKTNRNRVQFVRVMGLMAVLEDVVISSVAFYTYYRYQTLSLLLSLSSFGNILSILSNQFYFISRHVTSRHVRIA